MSRRRVGDSPRTPPYKRLYEQAIRQVEELTLQYETGQVEIEVLKRQKNTALTLYGEARAEARGQTAFRREIERKYGQAVDDIQAFALDPLRVYQLTPMPIPCPEPVSFWRRLWAS